MSRPTFKKSELSEHVRAAIVRLRKMNNFRQEHFAKAIGMQRSGYTKKETGTAPVTLDDLDAIVKHFNISLTDIFANYPGFYYETSLVSLSEEARKRWPVLEQVIKTANSLAGERNPGELKYILNCLEFAINRIEKESEIIR